MTAAPHVMAGPEFLAVVTFIFALGFVVGVFALRAWQLSCRRARGEPSLCGDPTCESSGCRQSSIDAWYDRMERDARVLFIPRRDGAR